MAAETRKSRKSNFSPEEVDVLVTTVMQNHNILYGETSKSFFHKEIRNQVWNIILEEVNKVSLERRTLNEVKNKWKKCQHSSRKVETPEKVLDRVDCDDLGYEPSFKRSVILYAEQKNNQEARKRFGISEETIRRWRKLRQDIMEKAQQSIRRSQRHTMGHGSFSESGSASSSGKKGTEIDSMPLQQRLSQNHNEAPAHSQETVLQSQPISPTKLKVTRQGKPQQPPARVPTPPPPIPPQVCLKWNSHHTNMQSAFPSLLTREQYVDATLVSEGKTLKCHRMILSSCSPYFEEVLNGIGPFQHPVLFMKDIPFWILKALCDFMYAGEVHIPQEKLQELLDVASTLKIKGLASSVDAHQDTKPVMPEIKQEVEPAPSPRITEKPLKEEKEEEPPPPPPKLTRHEVARPSKKREDRRSKHSAQTAKEKVVEEPLPTKVAPKVAPKVALPKLPTPAAKATVKNVVRNVVKPVPKPSASRTTHASRRSDSSRRSDKHKLEAVVQKEKEKEKEKPSLKKDNINDPLDLLQPVYEEIAKEDPPPPPKSVSPSKLKERANVPVKKSMNRKVKKRRYAEYAEDREESPPPLFQSRKGTRSRPNVKIPKYFHALYDDSSTIVREPHTDQNDPLIGVEVSEIKAEPLDVEENTIDVEENLVNFMVQDQEISQEGEEIIGNYDSPLVNIKLEPKRNTCTPNIFKKVLDTQPVIVNIHTVSTESNLRLLDIKEENVQIVDISTISTGATRMEEETAINEPNSFVAQIEPPSAPPHESPSDIIISSVQSMAELPPEEARSVERDKRITQGVSNLDLVEEEIIPSKRQKTDAAAGDEPPGNEEIALESYAGVGVKPLEALTTTLGAEFERPEVDPLAPVTAEKLNVESPSEVAMETDEPPLEIRIENVRSEEVEEEENLMMQLGSESSDKCDASGGSLVGVEMDTNRVAVSSLGSLEAKIDGMDFNGGDSSVEETSGGSQRPSSSGVEMERDDAIQTNNRIAGSSLGSLEAKIDKMDVSAGDSSVEDSGGSQHQSSQGAGSSLGSLEAKVGTLDLNTNASASVEGKGSLGSPSEAKAVTLLVSKNSESGLDKEENGSSAENRINIEENVLEPSRPLTSINVNLEEVSSNVNSSVSEEEPSASNVAANEENEENQRPVELRENANDDNPIPEAIEDQCPDVVANEELAPETVEFHEDNLECNALHEDKKFRGPDLDTKPSLNEELASQDVELRESVSQEDPEDAPLGDVAKIRCPDVDTARASPNEDSALHEVHENLVIQHIEADTRASPNEESAPKGVELHENPESQHFEASSVKELAQEDVDLQENSSDKQDYTHLPVIIVDPTGSIEAELEQCLASTSHAVPPISTEKSTVSFENDEDFTKDIEFDDFVVVSGGGGGNRPANYLGIDFAEDFNVEEEPVDDVDFDDERGGNNETERGDDLDYEGLTESDEALEEYEHIKRNNVDERSRYNPNADNIVGRSPNALETYRTIETPPKVVSKNVENQLQADRNIEPPRNTLAPKTDAEDRAQIPANFLEANKQKESLQNTRIDVVDLSRNIEQKVDTTRNFLETERTMSPNAPNTHTHNDDDEREIYLEDERRMEESLLADLDDDDDDIVMKDASTRRTDDEDSEKTLEMIVNDLNESLGEMRK